MSNMSYCRWSNSAGDMSDCVEAQRSFSERDTEGYSNDNPSEELDVPPTNFEALSEHEKTGYYECLRLAAQMLEQATEEDLANADVSLARLAA